MFNLNLLVVKIKRLFFTILFILVLAWQITQVSQGFGWSGHSIYTYLLLKELEGEVNFELNFPVNFVVKDFKEERVYNENGNLGVYLKEDVIGKVKLRHMEWEINEELESIYSFLNQPSFDGVLNSIQIIAFYSSFPDIGIDYLKNHSLIQDILLGNSQALRHGKVKIGPIEVFEADQSFLYFIKKSEYLLKSNNTYWGLRFLGYALHYLEDIMQPYHVRPGTVFELMLYPFDQNIRQALRNLHSAYDDMLMYLMLYDTENFKKVLKESKPIYFNSYESLIYEAYIYSYLKFFKIHKLQKIVFKDIIYQRRPNMKDFCDKKDNHYFKELVDETYSIISTMSGVIKGLLKVQLSYLENDNNEK